MNLLRAYKDKVLYDFGDEVIKVVSRVRYGDMGDTRIRYNMSVCHVVVRIDYPDYFPYLFVPNLKEELRKLGAQYGCPEGFCITQDDFDDRMLIIGTTVLLDLKRVEDGI